MLRSVTALIAIAPHPPTLDLTLTQQSRDVPFSARAVLIDSSVDAILFLFLVFFFVSTCVPRLEKDAANPPHIYIYICICKYILVCAGLRNCVLCLSLTLRI